MDYSWDQWAFDRIDGVMISGLRFFAPLGTVLLDAWANAHC